MSPRPTWLATRSAELRAALFDLGLTLTDTEARKILDDKLTEYARLMRVTRQTAQKDFTDERLISFARSLALSLSDEAPGADLIEFERTISMPVAAIGLTTAALAEALKVAHINLDDKEAVAGLSLLSTLGMITADASAFSSRSHAHCCCASPATSTVPQHRSPKVRTPPTDSTTPTAAISPTSSPKTPTASAPSPTPTTATPRRCGAPPSLRRCKKITVATRRRRERTLHRPSSTSRQCTSRPAHTPSGLPQMHPTTIATAQTHEKPLLAATLVHGYPAPLNNITDTRPTDNFSGSATQAEKHLTPCP